MAVLLKNATGTLVSSDGKALSCTTGDEFFSDNFASGGFTNFDNATLWGAASSNTIESPGGVNHYLSSANPQVGDVVGKAYLTKEFTSALRQGDRLILSATINLPTLPTDGNVFFFDTECRDCGQYSPGIRVYATSAGHLYINRSKIGIVEDIAPEASYPLTAGSDFSIIWDFTMSTVGPSILTVNGNTVHDGAYDMTNLTDLFYQYSQMGVTANSCSTQQNMIVRSFSYEIIRA